MQIREIILEDAAEEYKLQIVITNEDGSETTMPKALYEAQLEAAKDASN